jgi:protein-disulfide isomerase
MQNQRSRGREVPRRSSNRSTFVLIGLLVAVAAVVGIGLWAASRTQQTVAESRIPVIEAVRPYSGQSGFTDDGFAYKGDPSAPVTVVEYSDFQCPACASAEEALGSLLDQYAEQGRIQFIYHEFPLPQHTNAIPTAAAARCAGEQDSYWQMHNLIFARQREWSNDRNITPRLTRYAEEISLERGAFEQCLSGGTYTQALQAAAQSGQQRGVNATPTFFVNDQRVQTGDLITAIEAALAAGGN